MLLPHTHINIVYIYMCANISNYLYIYLSIHPSIHPSIYLFSKSIYLSTYRSIYLCRMVVKEQDPPSPILPCFRLGLQPSILKKEVYEGNPSFPLILFWVLPHDFYLFCSKFTHHQLPSNLPQGKRLHVRKMTYIEMDSWRGFHNDVSLLGD